MQLVVVVQEAQQVHPPGVITIALRPTEVTPSLPVNFTIVLPPFLSIYQNNILFFQKYCSDQMN